MEYKIVLTPTAREMLADIQDRRTRESITRRIDELRTEPGQRGSPLWSSLEGYRDLRAAGQRYRIIYRVEDQTVTVLVVAIGIRKEGDKGDIYELTQRLLRLGLV